MARQLLATYAKTVSKTDNSYTDASERQQKSFPLSTSLDDIYKFGEVLSESDPDANWQLCSCVGT